MYMIGNILLTPMLDHTYMNSMEPYVSLGDLQEEFDMAFLPNNCKVQKINCNSIRVIGESANGFHLKCRASVGRFVAYKLDGGWMKPIGGYGFWKQQIDRISGALIETEAGIFSFQTENSPLNSGTFMSFYEGMFKVFPAPGNAQSNYAAIILSKVEDLALPSAFSGFDDYLVPSVGAGSLGYCTWNGIGLDVSTIRVLEAVSSLRDAGALPGWVVLDDGWQQTDNSRRLLENVPDNNKFPNGLKGLVNQMKDDFGIQSVFIWTAVIGYWEGITENFAESQEIEAVTDQNGRLIFAPTTGGVFKYYDQFFKYLRSEGIAGVKCDVLQIIEGVEVPGIYSTNQFYNAYRDALATSAARHDLELIWCGGMVPWVLQRTPGGAQFPSWVSSCAFRNSDDFFPSIYNSHLWHIYCNFLNSVYTRQFGCPLDFDMFQTTLDPPFSRLHIAARIMSGGPVYVTDETGKHDSKIFSEFMLSHGKIPFFNGPPRVQDPLKGFGKGLLEVHQYWKGSKVVAMFNLQPPGTKPIPYSISSPPGYVSLSYNNYSELGSGMFEIVMQAELFPVGSIGHAAVYGYIDKMAGIAAVLNYRYSEMHQHLFLELSAGGGVLGILWPRKNVKAYISGQNKPLSIDFEGNIALIQVPPMKSPEVYVE